MNNIEAGLPLVSNNSPYRETTQPVNNAGSSHSKIIANLTRAGIAVVSFTVGIASGYFLRNLMNVKTVSCVDNGVGITTNRPPYAFDYLKSHDESTTVTESKRVAKSAAFPTPVSQESVEKISSLALGPGFSSLSFLFDNLKPTLDKKVYNDNDISHIDNFKSEVEDAINKKLITPIGAYSLSKEIGKARVNTVDNTINKLQKEASNLREQKSSIADSKKSLALSSINDRIKKAFQIKEKLYNLGIELNRVYLNSL